MSPAAGPQRLPPTKFVIFNHKGGVGKTTLTVNIASEIAALGRRVLLVDSDPQCNLTSYLIADDVVDDLLDHSDGPQGQTLWSAVKPVVEGTGDVKEIRPVEPGHPGMYVVPGDIRLSEFEADLTVFWSECLQRKPRGFRGTMALSNVVNKIASAIGAEFIFYDVGPNIGALNRAVLLDADFFIVPVACDLFSLRALKTLGRSLVSWIEEWATIASLAPKELYLLSGRPQFLGYIPEGFRVYGGRVMGHQSHFLSRIERDIQSQIVAVLRSYDSSLAPGKMAQHRLGEVQNFGALVPASQDEGLSMSDVQAGSPAQRQAAKAAFSGIAKKIVTAADLRHAR